MLFLSNDVVCPLQSDLRPIGNKVLPSDINSGRTEKVSGIHVYKVALKRLCDLIKLFCLHFFVTDNFFYVVKQILVWDK